VAVTQIENMGDLKRLKEAEDHDKMYMLGRLTLLRAGDVVVNKSRDDKSILVPSGSVIYKAIDLKNEGEEILSSDGYTSFNLNGFPFTKDYIGSEYKNSEVIEYYNNPPQEVKEEDRNKILFDYIHEMDMRQNVNLYGTQGRTSWKYEKVDGKVQLLRSNNEYDFIAAWYDYLRSSSLLSNVNNTTNDGVLKTLLTGRAIDLYTHLLTRGHGIHDDLDPTISKFARVVDGTNTSLPADFNGEESSSYYLNKFYVIPNGNTTITISGQIKVKPSVSGKLYEVMEGHIHDTLSRDVQPNQITSDNGVDRNYFSSSAASLLTGLPSGSQLLAHLPINASDLASFLARIHPNAREGESSYPY
jgi:hypothetical protein